MRAWWRHEHLFFTLSHCAATHHSAHKDVARVDAERKLASKSLWTQMMEVLEAMSGDCSLQNGRDNEHQIVCDCTFKDGLVLRCPTHARASSPSSCFAKQRFVHELTVVS